MTPTPVPLASVAAEDDTAPHPSDGDIAAYLEAQLPNGDRATLEAHIADCEYCRARLVLAGELVATAPRVKRRSLLYPIGLIAAAAGLAALLLLPGPALGPPERAEFRAEPGAGELQRLRILQPPRGGIMRRDAPRLVWSGMGTDALYQITLSSADGSVLWSERTSDTTATPPAPVVGRMRSGDRYFWRVDGLLPNLHSVTTGDQPFSMGGQ